MPDPINHKLTSVLGVGTVVTADFAKKLMSGIAESRQSTIIAGGKPFLRMLKSSEWVFGPSDEEVQPGSQWIVNLMTLQHGWSCWVENELKGEVMDSMANPKPAKPAPIEGVDYKEQRSFELKCRNGHDAGTEVLYKTSSLGGMRAVDDLLSRIHNALMETPATPFPVLVFGSEHYEHNKYGRIYTPILEVVGWADLNGNILGEQQKLAEPEQPKAAAPKRQRKPPVEQAPQAPAEPEGPRPTQAAHVGQRRRPGAQPTL
jgi:hypothetical protein